MTVKELIEKLQAMPEDARVELNMPLQINAQESAFIRGIDSVNYYDKNHVVSLNSYWRATFFY